jgi:hypothetical protein
MYVLVFTDYYTYTILRYDKIKINYVKL